MAYAVAFSCPSSRRDLTGDEAETDGEGGNSAAIGWSSRLLGSRKQEGASCNPGIGSASVPDIRL